jgi:hypothetical protein
VPHDASQFVARQEFTNLPHNHEHGTVIPPVLIFAAADSSRTVGFNNEIRRAFVTPNDQDKNVAYVDDHQIHVGLYSERVNCGSSDIAEEGFRLLLPFALRPHFIEGQAPRKSDGSFVTPWSLTELFQHGGFHPFGGEWQAQRLERLLDHWRGLTESGVWTVGKDGVEGGIDKFMDAVNGAWNII